MEVPTREPKFARKAGGRALWIEAAMKTSIPRLLFSSALLISCSQVAASDRGDTGPSPQEEKRSFTVTLENVAEPRAFTSWGTFDVPAGDSATGPATSGKSFEFMVRAGRSQRLFFVTMLAVTNDLFFAPDGDGIALYDENGQPVSGEVTDRVYLWDAGTEVNEEPGVGMNTFARQVAPDIGIAENRKVVKVAGLVGDPFNYPSAAELIAVVVTHVEGSLFKIAIQNVSALDAFSTSEGEKQAPITPGVWVVRGGRDALFSEGTVDRKQGLERVVEDGDPAALAAFVAPRSGVSFPVSPGVWAVHATSSKPFFTQGQADYGMGLESVAEDGDPAMLSGAIARQEGVRISDVFTTPVGRYTPEPIETGLQYSFTFEAGPGEALSFVAMLAASNDTFIAPSQDGIPLFDENGVPISGDVSDRFFLWDAGTEVNEEPAVGPNTVTNQQAPDTGIVEGGNVELLADVVDGFTLPTVNQILKVTIDSK